MPLRRRGFTGPENELRELQNGICVIPGPQREQNIRGGKTEFEEKKIDALFLASPSANFPWGRMTLLGDIAAQAPSHTTALCGSVSLIGVCVREERGETPFYFQLSILNL